MFMLLILYRGPLGFVWHLVAHVIASVVDAVGVQAWHHAAFVDGDVFATRVGVTKHIGHGVNSDLGGFPAFGEYPEGQS